MSAVLQRKFDGTGLGAVEELAVEGSRGKEGASWQTMENAGKRQVPCMLTKIIIDRKIIWKINQWLQILIPGF